MDLQLVEAPPPPPSAKRAKTSVAASACDFCSEPTENVCEACELRTCDSCASHGCKCGCGLGALPGGPTLKGRYKRDERVLVGPVLDVQELTAKQGHGPWDDESDPVEIGPTGEMKIYFEEQLSDRWEEAGGQQCPRPPGLPAAWKRCLCLCESSSDAMQERCLETLEKRKQANMTKRCTCMWCGTVGPNGWTRCLGGVQTPWNHGRVLCLGCRHECVPSGPNRKFLIKTRDLTSREDHWAGTAYASASSSSTSTSNSPGESRAVAGPPRRFRPLPEHAPHNTYLHSIAFVVIAGVVR